MALFSDENYYGNVEYKLLFNVHTKFRLDKYITGKGKKNYIKPF